MECVCVHWPRVNQNARIAETLSLNERRIGTRRLQVGSISSDRSPETCFQLGGCSSMRTVIYRSFDLVRFLRAIAKPNAAICVSCGPRRRLRHLRREILLAGSHGPTFAQTFVSSRDLARRVRSIHSRERFRRVGPHCHYRRVTI